MTGVKYLVDTDWIVPALKGRVDAQSLLISLAVDGLAISLISYGEIYEGIYAGRDPKHHEQVFLLFLRGVTVLPLSKSIVKEFAQVRGQLRAAGNIIPDFDLLIASTAIHHGLTLVTRNVRHFQRVTGLILHS